MKHLKSFNEEAKDSWNREEIKQLFLKFNDTFTYASNEIGISKWLSENL